MTLLRYSEMPRRLISGLHESPQDGGRIARLASVRLVKSCSYPPLRGGPALPRWGSDVTCMFMSDL